MNRQKRLLIVDDDRTHRVIYATIAGKMDYQVDLADSPRTADRFLRAKHYDGVILDLTLGEDSGDIVLALMSRIADKPRVLVVTSASDSVIDESFQVGRGLGVEMFGPVRKPINVASFRTKLKDMDDAERAGAAP